MNLQPLGQRVVVSPKQAEETTASGIVLAQSNKEKPMQGTVVAAGTDCKFVKNGDTVIFKKYSPTEFDLADGTEVYLLDEEDLLATLS